MGRPQLNYTNMIFGTLLIGDRISGGKHARFSYTCTACGTEGETDARYLTKRATCTQCKTAGVAKRILVVNAFRAAEIPVSQLTMAYRDSLKDKSTYFYYDWQKADVSEVYDGLNAGVHLRYVDADGKPQQVFYSSTTQQMKPGYDSLPEDFYDIKTEKRFPPPPEPVQESMELVIIAAPPPLQAPEGSLTLARDDDKVWADESYEAVNFANQPEYITAWKAPHPDGTTYRMFGRKGEWFMLTTPPPERPRIVDLGFADDEPVLTPEEVEAQRLKAKKQEDSWLAQQIDDYAEKALHDPRARGNLAELAKRSSQAKEKLDAIMAKLYPAPDTTDAQPFKLVSVKTKESSSEV